MGRIGRRKRAAVWLPSLLFLCYIIVQDKQTDDEALDSSVEAAEFVTEVTGWPEDGELIDMEAEEKDELSWRDTMESRSDNVSSVCSSLPPSSLVLQHTRHSGTKVKHRPSMETSPGSSGRRVREPSTPRGVHPPQDGGWGLLVRVSHAGLRLMGPVLTTSGRPQPWAERGEGKECICPKSSGSQVVILKSKNKAMTMARNCSRSFYIKSPRHPLERFVSAYRMIFQDW